MVVDVVVELGGLVVDGVVEVLICCEEVVLVDGAGTVVVEELDETAAPAVLDPLPVEEPDATGSVDEPRDTELLGREPSVRGADFVWNVSTPARPATVATITIGVRLTGVDLLESASIFNPPWARTRMLLRGSGRAAFRVARLRRRPACQNHLARTRRDHTQEAPERGARAIGHQGEPSRADQ